MTSFMKVKWTRVPDLVEKRRVFLKNGWAYVPGKEQSSIVFQEFQVQLEKALEVCIFSISEYTVSVRT
jgi:DNA primase large subunit